MATLWDLVTSNSDLPDELGNTFWDHINNQQTGVNVLVPIIDEVSITEKKSTLSIVELDKTLSIRKIVNKDMQVLDDSKSINIGTNSNGIKIRRC